MSIYTARFILRVGLVLSFLMILLATLLPSPAHSEWRPEYAEAPPATREWYSSQEVNPEARARFGRRYTHKSCCGNGDVFKTRFRLVNDGTQYGSETYEYLKDDTWRIIPPDIIQHKKTPDGRPVLFINASSGLEVCFIIDDPGI